MIEPPLFWLLSFLCLFITFVYIIAREKDTRFFIYFVSGAVVGLFFDTIQVYMGYYHYSDGVYYVFLNGVPVTMTLAEGFCIAITIYLFEKLPWLFGLVKPFKK
jgi:hypothetical protein